jgi:hypothetical protein
VRVAAMHGCQHPASTHPAAPPTPFRETVKGWVSFHPTRPGGQTHGPLCGRITPTSTHPASSPTPVRRDAIRVWVLSSTLAPAGGPRAVFSSHVRLLIKPRTSRASVGECATPRCTVHRILHRKSWPPSQRAEARTWCVLRVTVTPAPSCMGHSAAYRSLSVESDRLREGTGQ